MAVSTRITGLFGCRHPIQQAGMGAMAPELALAVAAAGGLGMLSGVVGNAALTAHLELVPEGAPIGVNFLTPFLDRAAVETAAARGRLVEFFWGAPDAELVQLVHDVPGTRAAWQVGSTEEARAAADAGCDLVIAQGQEAGGHVRGTTGLLPLLDEVRAAIDLPVIAAGGIGSGRAVAAVLAAGADAVRVGTRFVAATESNAHPDYVDALIAASADDTVLTTSFGTGWPNAPHRVLKSCVEAGEALGEAQGWTPNWPTASDDDARVATYALYAGQSVGAVRRRQSAAEILAELMEEVDRAR